MKSSRCVGFAGVGIRVQTLKFQSSSSKYRINSAEELLVRSIMEYIRWMKDFLSIVFSIGPFDRVTNNESLFSVFSKSGTIERESGLTFLISQIRILSFSKAETSRSEPWVLVPTTKRGLFLKKPSITSLISYALSLLYVSPHFFEEPCPIGTVAVHLHCFSWKSIIGMSIRSSKISSFSNLASLGSKSKQFCSCCQSLIFSCKYFTISGSRPLENKRFTKKRKGGEAIQGLFPG